MSSLEGNDRALVTFALFAYNQERYIREAVEGALAQTYSPLEIILSDDCSSDQTFEIMRSVASEYKGPHRIVLNRNPSNMGTSTHVNRVVELSQARFLVFAAGDDISLPHRVDVLTRELSDPVAVVYSSSTLIDEHGAALREESVHPDPNNENSYAYRARTYCRGVVGASAAYHKKIFERFGPLLPTTIAEDRALAFRGYAVGKVRFVNEPLVKYRTHERNVWSTKPATSSESLRRMVSSRAKIRTATYVQFIADLQSQGVTGADPADVEAACRICRQRLTEAETEQLVLSLRWKERLAGLWLCLTRSMNLYARIKLLLIGTARWAYLRRLKSIGARFALLTNAH